jgi:deoxyribonuclease-4
LLRVGFHVSIAGTIDEAVDRAAALGCNTFQIFTRTPRAWGVKELTEEETAAFIDKVNRHGMNPVFAHMPYLVNLASAKDEVNRLSVETLKAELHRCARLQVPYLVTHLGSHLGFGKRRGMERIVKAIDEAYGTTESDVMLLLENTAGTRNSMGGSFRDIQRIIGSLARPERVGVCFDTAHGYAAGYDLGGEAAVEDTVRRFDEAVGFERLKLVHLNDSRGGLGSRVDRHEHIGRGMIGEKGFRAILHSRLGGLPLILETPKEDENSDVDNLRKVRELAGEL